MDATAPKFRLVENQYFHSRSRVAFLSPRTVVLTGIPLSADAKSKTCVEIDLETMEITALPDLLRPRYWHTASFFQGKVIVTGGKTGKNQPSLESVEALDTKNSTWSSLKDMNFGRDSHSECVTDEGLYVFGGVADTEQATSIERYMNEKWTLLPVHLPIIVGLTAVGPLSSTEVVIAGGNSSRETLCMSFNLQTGAASDLPELPHRSLFVSGMYKVIDRKLVVLTESRALLQLDLSVEGGQWVELASYGR